MWQETLYLECDCTDAEHTVRLARFLDEDCLYMSMQMSPWLPWWKRLWVGVKYIVLGRTDVGHWGDSLVTGERIQPMIDFLHRVKLQKEAG